MGPVGSGPSGLGSPSMPRSSRTTLTPLLARLGDLIITGPTGTNVADLMLVMVAGD